MMNCARIALNCAELRPDLNKINDIAIPLETNILSEKFCCKINTIAIPQFLPLKGTELRANPANAGYCAAQSSPCGNVGGKP